MLCRHGEDRQGEEILSVSISIFTSQEKFRLVHSDVSLFHSSEWERDDCHPSTWYVVYRIVLALAMVTGISLHFVSTLETLGSKWFIYMTNQGRC